MHRFTFTGPCGCGIYSDAADVAHALAALMARIKEPSHDNAGVPPGC